MSAVTTLSHPSDEALMARVQREDRAAYELLYARWKQRVLDFLLRRTCGTSQAEDAFQETWLRVYRWRHRFDTQRNFRAWLFTIAVHAGYDAPKPQPIAFRFDQQPGDPMDLRDRLVSALHGLAAEDRRLLLLLGEGFTTAEVAEMVGMGHSAVRMRISRARKRIREARNDA
jgi:RNA polymerase sigma-70 factor, ECF subfamily